MLEAVPNGLSIGSNNMQVHSPTTPHSHWSQDNLKNDHFNGRTPVTTTNTPAVGLFPEKDDVHRILDTANDVSGKMVSRPDTSDGHEEEADVIREPRMLQDPTGRYCE